MKNNKTLKAVIIAVVITVIITGGIGVTAMQFFADKIMFTPSDSEWEVNNVADAIDDLYVKKEKIEIRVCAHTWKENTKGGGATVLNTYNYKYLKLKDFEYENNSQADIYFTDGQYNIIAAEIDKEYDLETSDISYLYITEEISSSYGWACVTAELYN